MAVGAGSDGGIPAAQPGSWVDLAAQLPGHGVLAHIRAQLAAAAVPHGAISTVALQAALRPWAVGFVGEEAVGLELALLDPQWRVLHSVAVGRHGADIDHLLIGPPGIFAVTARHHRGGPVDVRRDALSWGADSMMSARQEAHLVRAALAAELPAMCPVTPIICTVGATPPHQGLTDGFWVIEDHRLVGALSALDPVLSAEQVDLLYDRARRSTTWRPTPPPPAAPAEIAVYVRHLAARTPPGTRPSKPSPAAPRSPGAGSSAPGPRSAHQRLLLVLAAIGALLFVAPGLTQGTGPLAGGLFASSQTAEQDAAYRASADLPVQTVHQPCTDEGRQGRAFLSSQLLTCQRTSTDALVWEYVNPWRRLPTALQGARCQEVGAHARNYGRGDAALVCTSSEDGQARWVGDPGWTPSP